MRSFSSLSHGLLIDRPGNLCREACTRQCSHPLPGTVNAMRSIRRSQSCNDVTANTGSGVSANSRPRWTVGRTGRRPCFGGARPSGPYLGPVSDIGMPRVCAGLGRPPMWLNPSGPVPVAVHRFSAVLTAFDAVRGEPRGIGNRLRMRGLTRGWAKLMHAGDGVATSLALVAGRVLGCPASCSLVSARRCPGWDRRCGADS